MNLEMIRRIARSRGVNPGRRCKKDIIRSIQTDEGNFDCFSTANTAECDQSVCMWRQDCFESAQEK